MQIKGSTENIYGTPLKRFAMLGVMTIGKRIRELRLALGMNQGELAKAAKIAQSTLSDLERGDSARPRGDSLVQLASVLKVDHDWLMTGEGSPTPRSRPDLDSGHLLAIFEHLSEANRAVLIATARALHDSQPEARPIRADGTRLRKHNQ